MGAASRLDKGAPLVVRRASLADPSDLADPAFDLTMPPEIGDGPRAAVQGAGASLVAGWVGNIFRVFGCSTAVAMHVLLKDVVMAVGAVPFI